MRRVVITGLGVVSPAGSGKAAFWERITAGVGGIGRLDRFDPEGYASQIAGQVRDFDADAYVSSKEQRRMDLFGVFAVAAAKMAVADAGIDWTRTDTERCGVAVTSGIGGIGTMAGEQMLLAEKGPRRISPFAVPQMIINMPAGLIAIEYGLKGPNFATVTACAAALHAIGLAFRSIRHGEADVMLAGGAEAPLTPIGLASFGAMRALSTRNDDPEHACRPFDRERDGFIMGEGAGVVVLEEYGHAARRGATVYAELAGFGMTCDAHHMTAPREDGAGAMRAMQAAMRDAGLAPGDIDYINAHGTSTPLNDASETLAIKRAFGDAARRVMVSSSKSMTGHLLGAAGGVESVVCALAIRDGVVPPTINYTTPDPACDLDYVPNTARAHPVRACLNNSFGFGGHNACLAFKRV